MPRHSRDKNQQFSSGDAMRKLFSVALVIVGIITMVGCTANERAKRYGGTMKIELPAQQKLVVATWKDDHLWYLTRPMRAGEQAEVYTFHEDSSWGVMQGTVLITEHTTK